METKDYTALLAKLTAALNDYNWPDAAAIIKKDNSILLFRDKNDCTVLDSFTDARKPVIGLSNLPPHPSL
jgi:hypothetical protein